MAYLIPFPEIALRLPMLNVACSRCDRRGRYQSAPLAERFADVNELKAWLKRDCLKATAPFEQDRCSIYFPDLAEAMKRP